jgi:hypothetical protein
VRAKLQKVVPIALAARHLAAKLQHPPKPEKVQTDMSPAPSPKLRNYILNHDLEHILNRTQQKPFNNLIQRLKRGFQDRVETARWAETWPVRWQIWRTMLAVGRTDTGQMLLGRTPEK